MNLPDPSFTDAEGTTWYVSEGDVPDHRVLYFHSVDESRRLTTFPPHWKELSRQELSMLFSQAKRTWARRQ